MKFSRMALFVILVCAVSSAAMAQGLDVAKIDEALGRSGQKMGETYRVGFPRTDLRVTVRGVTVKPGLALGSWAAFMGTDEHAMVMGDLVLLEDELNPVMEKLRAAGFDITAVHNHLIDETPKVLYLHYMGQGTATGLASSLRAALAISATPLEKPLAAAAEAPAPEWVKTVESAMGRDGALKGGVLSYGVPRADAVTMNGVVIPPAAGVAEAINFQAADGNNVATTGDFVLTAEEVNPVISALEQHHIQVTALHSHMLSEQPRLFFMHFWGYGPAQAVAEGMRAGLEKVHIKAQ
ncbi:MAG TPA: DUF1259 domain-containing protein [Candidatus Acidoferrum sp.]|jgi:hypothetical protein